MSSSSSRNNTSAPSERPIQLRWIVFVFSGQSISVEVVQQLVGVRGDPEEPLHHVPRDDGRPAALAPAVDHVLVGDDRLVLRAPVDRRLLAIGQPRLEELQEQPLRPAVVLDLVRGRLAVPVDHPAQASHLGADVRDVPLHDLARMPALADRGILGGQAERVEAHRAHHAPAGAPPVMRDHIAQRVVEDVPHVQRPGGVREHLEHVELPLRLAAGLGVRRVEGPLGLPDLLPLLLDCCSARTRPCLPPGTKKPLNFERPWEAPRGSRRVRFLR